MRNQFAETMLELGKDEKVVLLAGDIGVFGFRNFKENYPKRFYNIGICEQATMSVGAGLSLNGMIPIIHSITPFITERCYEQIKDDFCYQKLNGNIVSVGSSFDYAGLGCTHHSYSDIAILRSLPRTQIIYPASQKELDLLLKQTYNNDKLTYFRLPAKKHSQKILDNQIEFGKGIKIREGKSLTIVVTGPQLDNVMESVKNLEIDAEIIYIHTIKPIDKEMILESANKTQKVLTIEEHSILGGLADEVARITEHLGIINFRMGIKDRFLRYYGNYEGLCEVAGLSVKAITKKLNELK